MAILEEVQDEHVVSASSQSHTKQFTMAPEETEKCTEYVVKNGPIELLDLPLDILQQIVSHTTHTNDLCALALTHSSLHSLVVPYIYSRFDIVWPEANPTVDSRIGVDALTYGLATLVMAHDVFGEIPTQLPCSSCQHCSHHNVVRAPLQSRSVPMKIRRGNYFAHFTRKFSLGNGPTDWVSEYSITKEGGKMLGTLVALALGRMRNLEAFVWDMPTGVLRDVWIALASLANRNDGAVCRLEKIWVRWHDNRDAPQIPPGAARQALPSLLQGSASSLFHIPPYPIVEFPTFSVLPALKSISVLDIDEVSYAEELGLLLERSVDKLRELRIGVAIHAQRNIPFRPIEDRSVVPPGTFLPCDNIVRPGGILGILFGPFCVSPTPQPIHGYTVTSELAAQNIIPHEDRHPTILMKDLPGSNVLGSPADVDLLTAMLSTQTLHVDPEGVPIHPEQPTPVYQTATSTPRPMPKASSVNENEAKEHHRLKLQLSTLELERVYLSSKFLSRAIDWSRLDSLTLLGCINHEELWSALKKSFAPSASRNRTPNSRYTSAPSRHRASSSLHTIEPSEYRLKIKKLHTDTVCKQLLDFIKTTLAPDTLEWLFLQQTTSYRSTVDIDDIYKSAIKRHKGSLRKLLIDSELRNLPRHERERDREDENNWKKWAFNENLIMLITSGKMHLRELSMSITNDGWHYFLKRLPNATSLRSLHISHIVNHPFARQYDREEIARSILNIVAVRPEIELCYFGIEKKCYEILEYSSTMPRQSASSGRLGTIGVTTHTMIEDDEDDDIDHDDGGAAHHTFIAADLSEDDDNDDTNSNVSSRADDTEDEGTEDDQRSLREPEFQLREILFYDDKISIFKARHGKL